MSELKTSVRQGSLLAATAVLAASNVVCAQIPCEYKVTAIIQAPECPPFGFPPTLPRGMNDVGWVVGNINSCVIGPDVAFSWTPQGGLEILDMPRDALQSRAIDINDHPDGQIVGTVDINDVGTRAFLIDGEDIIIISPPNDGTFSSVAALNNKRQVIGTTADGTPFSKAYLWEDGVLAIIEPKFGPRSAADDINDAGTVVGWMGTSNTIDSHSFIWNNGKMIDLGLAPNTIATSATGINDVNQILIWGIFNEDDPEGRLTGSFLLQDGAFIDLGALPLYDVINGRSVNNNSQVVGMARAVDISDKPDIGFIWQGGTMANLNDLLPNGSQLHIQRAEAIDESGQIAARAVNADNEVVAVLLTPIQRPLGDLDGDCQVGASDLLILLSNWGACEDCATCPADLDDNCFVGASDLLTLLVNWG